MESRLPYPTAYLPPSVIQIANFAAVIGQTSLVNGTVGPFVATLPPANSTTNGQLIAIKEILGGVAPINVMPMGADTIDGVTSFLMTAPFQAVMFMSDGASNWNVVANSANRYSQPWAQCVFDYPTIIAGYNIEQIIENSGGDWTVEFKASIDTGIDQFIFQAIAVNNSFPAFCVDVSAANAPPDPTKQIRVQAFRGDGNESLANVTVKLTVWVIPTIPD